jgi:RNA polymerase sigma-70 factor (ECF subfamily)
MDSREQLIEQMLILRCQMGDKDAFAGLIERYQAPLRYFVIRLLDDAQVSEDILQEIWLTVIGRIYGLKKAEAFSTWLYRIARNKVYQQLRKRKVWSELNENISAPNENEDDVVSLEDVAKVHRRLKKLRPEHKEVLMLRFLEQMSYQQISEVLSCNLGTVKSRVYYAKLALKKELEK